MLANSFLPCIHPQPKGVTCKSYPLGTIFFPLTNWSPAANAKGHPVQESRQAHTPHLSPSLPPPPPPPPPRNAAPLRGIGRRQAPPPRGRRGGGGGGGGGGEGREGGEGGAGQVHPHHPRAHAPLLPRPLPPLPRPGPGFLLPRHRHRFAGAGRRSHPRGHSGNDGVHRPQRRRPPPVKAGAEAGPRPEDGDGAAAAAVTAKPNAGCDVSAAQLAAGFVVGIEGAKK